MSFPLPASILLALLFPVISSLNCVPITFSILLKTSISVFPIYASADVSSVPKIIHNYAVSKEKSTV